MISYQQVKMPKLKNEVRSPTIRQAIQDIRTVKSQISAKNYNPIISRENLETIQINRYHNQQLNAQQLELTLNSNKRARSQYHQIAKEDQTTQKVYNKNTQNYRSLNKKYINIHDVNSYSMDNNQFATRQRLKNQAKRMKTLQDSQMLRSNRLKSTIHSRLPYFSLKNPKQNRAYHSIGKKHDQYDQNDQFRKQPLKSQENGILENQIGRKNFQNQDLLNQLTHKQIVLPNNYYTLREEQPKGLKAKLSVKKHTKNQSTIVYIPDEKMLKNHQRKFSLIPYLRSQKQVEMKVKSPLFLQDYLKILVQKIPEKPYRRNQHNMRELITYLNEFNRFFNQLKETIIVCLLKSYPIKVYNKGRQIYLMGEDCQSFHIIIHGKVKVYNLLTGMRMECQTGDTICQEIVFSKDNKRVRFQSCIAKTTTFLMEVKIDNFMKMKEQFSYFGYYQDQKVISNNLKQNYAQKSKIRKQYQKLAANQSKN